MVYLLEQIRKEFTKEIYKELTTRHLRIKKIKDIVIAYYYFSFIKRIVKQIIKKCNIC
jgi:hypothetical protein